MIVSKQKDGKSCRRMNGYIIIIRQKHRIRGCCESVRRFLITSSSTLSLILSLLFPETATAAAAEVAVPVAAWPAERQLRRLAFLSIQVHDGFLFSITAALNRERLVSLSLMSAGFT